MRHINLFIRSAIFTLASGLFLSLFILPQIAGAATSAAPSHAYLLLIKALNSSDAFGVRAALKAGANPNQSIKSGATPLEAAIVTCSITSRLAIVELLLNAGANPNKLCTNGVRPLMLAVNADDTSLVSALLQHGANVKEADDAANSQSLVGNAVQSGDVALVSLLLANGAAVNPLPASTYTDPLALACSSGNSDLVELLLYHGANVHETKGILGYATTPKDVDMLFDHGAIVFELNDEGLPPLIAVLKSLSGTKCVPVVQTLLDHGADPNITDSSGAPALLSAVDACANGETAPVTTLLNAGAKANSTNSVGWTPLMEAAYYGEPNVVSILLAHGANGSSIDLSGRSALTIAAAQGGYFNSATGYNPSAPVVTQLAQFEQIQAAQYTADGVIAAALIASGVSAVDSPGKAALQLATIAGKSAVVISLLNAGANPNIQVDRSIDRYALNKQVTTTNNNQQTASNYLLPKRTTLLMVAAKNGHADIVRALITHGAAVDLADENGNTALIYAAEAGDAKSAALLIKRGADPKHSNARGETALHLLALSGTTIATDIKLSTLKAGVSISPPNSSGAAQLRAEILQIQGATQSSDCQIAEDLITHGANPAAPDKSGETPIAIAKAKQNTALLNILTAHPAGGK